MYGLDPELLSMVEQPVKAVILLFPLSDLLEVKRKEEDLRFKAQAQSLLSSVFWIKQTISNACGTIGLLHALANSDINFVSGSPLAKFIEECKDKSPEQRAVHLETTPLFASIHADAASTGQTAIPTNLDTNLHFTCFVEAPSPSESGNRVIELDGRREGPVDRGECTDLLKDTARVIKDNYLNNSSAIQFSMVTLGPATA